MKENTEFYNAYGQDKPKEKQTLYHMNCVEVMIRAANDNYDLKLSDDCFKMLQGFGAGFYSEKTCGAFCGSLAALGVLYTEERPSDQAIMTKAAKRLVKEFEEEFGSLNCDYIKAHHRDPVTGCNSVKLHAAAAFSHIVDSLEK